MQQEGKKIRKENGGGTSAGELLVAEWKNPSNKE